MDCITFLVADHAIVGGRWRRRRDVPGSVWAYNGTGGRREAGAVAPAVDVSLVWGPESWGGLSMRGGIVVNVVDRASLRLNNAMSECSLRSTLNRKCHRVKKND